MGFLDFSGFGKAVGKAWSQWWDADAKPNLGLAYDMALATLHGFDDKSMKTVSTDWRKMQERDQGMSTEEGIMKALGPVKPLMSTIGEAAGVAAPEGFWRAIDTPREWVGRALTTQTLVTGPGGFMNVPLGTNLENVFDPEVWHKAWNQSRYMSPGQAIIGSMGAAWNDTDNKQDMDDVISYVNKQGNIPGKQEGWYRISTGALDFGANFLDPTVVGGKVAKLGKLRYIDKMLTPGKATERYLTSGTLQKVLDHSREVKSENQLRETAFSKSVYGGRQANVIYTLRHDEDAQRLAVRGFLGDSTAMDQLRERYPGSAEKILTAKTQDEWSELKNRADLADDHPNALNPAERERLKVFDDARTESAKEAYLDPDRLPKEVFLDHDTLGELEGTLTGLAAPRAGKVRQFTAALQQKSVYDRPIVVRMARPLANVGRMLSGDSRVITNINVNHEDGVNDLRQYLDRSTLEPAHVDKILSEYGAAPTPEVRSRIANEAEDAVIKSMAIQYGLGDADYQKILATAQKGRAAARLSTHQDTKQFVSEQLRNLQKKGLRESDSLAIQTVLDSDDNLTAILKQPQLMSQFADVVPLANIEDMKRVFRRNSGNIQTAKRAGGRALDVFQATADDFTSLWKVTTLLRGGWTVRMLSDEVGRQAALLGGVDTLAYGGRGAANAARNTWTRLKVATKVGFKNPMPQTADEQAEVLADMSRRYKAPTAATSAVHKWLPRAPTTEKLAIGHVDVEGKPIRKYASLEEAYIHGELTADDFVSAIEEAAKIGRLPENEAILLDRRNAGSLSETQFRKELFDYSLSKVDAASYADGVWPSRILDEASEGGRAAKPFTGESYDLDMTGKQVRQSRVITKRADGNYHPDDLYDFIADHRDELTYLDSELTVAPDKTGGLRLSVVSPTKELRKPEIYPGVEATGSRIRNVRAAMKQAMTQKQSQALQGFTVPSRHGGTIDVDAAFADETFARNVSSDGYAGGGQTNMLLGNFNTRVARQTSRPGWSGAIRYAEDPNSFKPAWERAVNQQLANDPIAQRMLRGDTDEQVMEFIESDAARRIRRAMPWYAEHPEVWVHTIRTNIDTQIPNLNFIDGNQIERNLRQEALLGRARMEDYVKAREGLDEAIPDVHGEAIDHAIGKDTVWEHVNTAVEKMMQILGTGPSDVISRNPFADRSYRAHMKDLIAGSEEMNKARVSAADLERLQGIARERARRDVKDWLYRSDSISLLAHRTRYMAAFMGATQDAITTWTKIAMNDPSVAVTLHKLWNAPEKAGLITDDQGNHLVIGSGGEEIWYHPVDVDENGNPVRVTPTEKNKVGQGRRVMFATPEGFPLVGRRQLTFPKDSLNTFLSINPGAGPIMSVAANEILLRNPTLGADENSVMGHVSKIILPFGPTSHREDILMSSTMKEAVAAWRQDEDQRFNSRTVAIWQTMMVDWAKAGRNGKAPSLDDAAKRSGDVGLLRLATAMVSPVQFQYKSPYQPYIDAYHILQREDPSTADMKFVQKYGEEYGALTAHVTESLQGLPASAEGYKFYEQYKDIIQEHPELLGLIMGKEGAGEFSKSVYEAQKEESLTPGGQKLRRPMTPEEIQKDVEIRMAWLKYTKFNDALKADLVDRGLKTVNDDGAEELRANKQAFLAQMEKQAPNWWIAYNTHNPELMNIRIKGMIEIAKDPRLAKRTEIQGLREYLILREQMKGVLADRKSTGGPSTLEAADNADLKVQWDDAVSNLLEKNTQFAQLHSRWLERDSF